MWRKTSQSREGNQQQTQPTYGIKSGNRSQSHSHILPISSEDINLKLKFNVLSSSTTVYLVGIVIIMVWVSEAQRTVGKLQGTTGGV